MRDQWKTLHQEIAYDNPWIAVSHRKVIAPTGKEGIYGVVNFKNTAVAIVPIDSQGNTWLVGQQRYPISRYSWEVPEGGAPTGQSLLAAAQRELREETGILAGMWTSLLHAHMSNSVSDEYAIAFVAQQLQYTDIEPDDTELITMKKVPLTEAIDMAADGQISDSLSMMCLLKIRLMIEREELVL
jgi:8-oxo-dGTP pyrophosphatase MutT (NUDIX family)